MFQKLIEKLKEFEKDHLRLVVAITNTILAVSMYISPEPHNFFFWFTLAFRIISVPIALFIGNKGLWIIYFIFCNVKALDITYNNYTCVALISLLFAMIEKADKKKAVLITLLYVTDIFIVAGLHNKSGFYIYTHFLLCSQFVVAMWKQKVNNSQKINEILILTPDEINILNQIKDNEPNKNVEGYSEMTVYRKLKDARERNNCTDNKELKNKYRRTNTAKLS